MALPIAAGLAEGSAPPLACPFCNKPVALDDPDTLYPSGIGWKFDDDLQRRTYHNFREVPPEQWCYTLHCVGQAGGCGAEMHADTKADALAKWNKRATGGLVAGAHDR